MKTESTILASDGTPLNVVAEGPVNGEPLILSNSLGTDLTMWDLQMPSLVERFRVIRYDTRGHGKSGCPAGDYDIARLAEDVLDIAAAQNWTSFNFAGVSMGGMTGLWIAANAGKQLRRALVANCAPYVGGATVWGQRIDQVAANGMASLAEMVVSRWFSPAFIAREPAIVADVAARFSTTSATGYIGCCAALRDMDLRADLAQIRAKVLLVGGEYDPTPPPAAIPGIASSIPGAEFTILNAAHLSNIEDPEGFTAALLGFISE